MAYTQTQWQTGDPITQSRLMKIEDGIAAAQSTADGALKPSDSQFTSVVTKVNTLQSVVGETDNEGLRRQVIDLGTRVDQAAGDNSPGVKAFNQIIAATTSNDPAYENLDTRFTAIESKDTSQDALIQAVSDSIDAAKRTGVSNDTLKARFEAVETTATTLINGYNSMTQSLINAGGVDETGHQQTLADRLNAIDGGAHPERTLPNVIAEITAAHGTNNTHGTLDNRFTTIETELNNAHSSTALASNGVDKSYASIDARFEAIEGELVGTTAMSSRLDSLTESIGTINSNISDLDTAYKAADSTLTNRINSLDTAYKAADTAITESITALTSTVSNMDTAYKAADSALANDIADLETADSAMTTRIDGVESAYQAADSALSTRITTAQNGVNTLQNTVNDSTTGLAATKAIADAAAATANAAATASDLTALAGRVTTLEQNPQSATTIIENVTYNSDGIPTNISNPSTDVDYLLKKDDKYYYWKYINNSWHLISGGGEGGGTSSAEFYASLLNVNDPSDTVDYFIGSGTNYVHYRYLNNQWVTILPSGLINYVAVDTSAVTEEENSPTKSRPIIKAYGSDTNLLADFTAIKSITATPINGGNDGYILAWTDIDGSVTDVTLTGGGAAATGTAVINRITNANLTRVAGENCVIEYTYVAKNSSDQLVAETVTATWYVNRIRVATSEATVNDLTDPTDKNVFDITPYLQPGTNNISVSINITIDGQTISRSQSWVVDVKNFSLIWDYDESIINDGSTVEFTCVPYGEGITKTLHIIVDNEESTQTVTTSNIPYTVTLTNDFEHGVHHAEMYMTATINGTAKTTNHISHDFIVAEAGETAPIIAATLPSAEMDQYDTIAIPFVVYTPNSNTSTVVLAVDGVTIDTREDVGRTTQRWYYTPSTDGQKVLTLTTGSVVKTLTLTVNHIDINNNEISGYAFKLKASEIPSNNALKAWYYDESNQNNTKLQFSNNFDWINGGIKTELDENDEIRQYIRIKSGTTMTIPYKMFATDPRANGSNFKIIFKVEKCRNYDAQVLDCISEGIGIQLNAHDASFQSTATTISTQYGEDEYTELEFEVYKATDSQGNPAANQYMMAWIDGVITTARPYGGNFVQSAGNESSIVIGSADCDVCLYLVKYYPKVLSLSDHIANFIADAPNAAEMMRRYTRNDILDPNDNEIDYQKLMNNNPDCRIWLYDIEKMPTSKDKNLATKVYNFQQLWKNGDDYYQITGTNGKLTIQGTSSVNYRKGAANTDINFGKSGATLVDGRGNNLLDENLEYKGFKLNDNSLPITYSNTKVNFASCEQVNNMCNAEWYQRYQPYPSLTARDCMEFTMGVQFIKDRGENEDTGEVRLFDEKPNRSDSKYYMYSIANMGTSKKNTHIFHSPEECCVEVMANTSRGERMLEWPSDLDWSGKVEGKDHSFELRYVEDENEDLAKAGWRRFIEWMVGYNLSPYDAETNPNGYTGAALPNPVTFAPYTFRGHNREVVPVEGRNFEQVLRGVTVNQYAGTYTNDTFEYRMAKMLSECEDYMAMDSVVYHFLFIERHTMVDNVAKNTFWSSKKEIGGPNNEEGFWIWDLSKNYDNDTSDGNNNEGQLVFDYGNEATDTYGAKTVFNAADSVWFIFISNLYEACRAMFINREGCGAWNAKNYHNYLLTEQRKVPERVWNECYWYDYLRTYERGIDTSWLTFLDGGQKIHQRKHFETYEELYDASKYMSALSASNTVTLRGYTPPAGTWAGVQPKTEFQVKMYNKCYLTIHVDDAYKQIKCAKGTNNIVSFYNNNDSAQGYTTMNDAVIKIDTAQMIQEIGDMSCLYPGTSSFAAATRLRVLQIGSNAEGYINPNMTSTEQLIFTNPMLEELGVQNLPYATYNLDLSKCPELKVLDASGSGFTGFEFANGGLLNEAYVNTPSSLIMRNLDYLTNANFHLTSPTSVTSLRLEGCKLFDNYTFFSALTNLGVIRLSGINWTFNNSTVLDNLLTLMGMNESGYTTPQSYLAGNVALTGVVYEGDYDKYQAAWSPDLVIDVSHASQFIRQHLVIYYNEDGTELHRRYINHNEPLVDPYQANLISIPTKTPDIEHRYTFGETDFAGDYIKYSGWRLKDDAQSITQTYGENPDIRVNNAMEIYAVYSTEAQQYIVRWLLRDNQVAAETPTAQNYGGGYDLAAPTIKDVHDAGFPTYTFSSNGDLCSYSIMTGWEKLPTNIAPTELGSTYDIYATWLERRDVNYNTVLTDDSYSAEEKLLVLKEMSAARGTLHLADTYPITLGYNGIKPAIDIVSTPTRFSGTTQVKNYMPFSVNKSFTMMIDYRFEHKTSNSSEAILLSCYGEAGNSVQGFKLYYNPQSGSPVPQIGFGNTDSQSSQNIQVIGSTINNRGVVVLRHIAGESVMYVYTGSTVSGLNGTYNRSEFRKTVTWSGINTDAKIVLGGFNVTQNSWMNATGTLYKVQYWEEDLGDGECAQLANWCHETINFAVQDWNGYGQHSALNSTLTANVVLHALNASEMGTISEDTINPPPSTIGWDPSVVRNFYNSRIYQALPTTLQSIIVPSPLAHIKGNFNGSQYIISTSSSTTTDCVFAPSCIEVGISTDPNDDIFKAYAVEASAPFAWYSANQMKILHYNNGIFEENATYNNPNYTNLRFPYCYNPVNKSVTVYVGYPSTSSSFYTWANSHAITLKTGDILIPDSGDIAYVYVATDEIVKGAPYTNSNESYLANTSGGWIPSIRWWTRSVPRSLSPTTNSCKFLVVNQMGGTSAGNVRYNNGLVYSIAL